MSRVRPPAFISRQVLDGRYLFGELTPAEGVDFVVACAGREDCAPDYRVERRGFRYHALEFVASGSWNLRMGGQEHVLGPGSVFSYGPDAGYRLRAGGGTALRKYFVDFGGERSRQLLDESGLSGGRPGVLPRSTAVREIFDQLLDCSDLSEEHSGELIPRLAELLLLRVRVDSQVGAPVRDRARESFERARRLIRERHASLVNVDQAARACGLSAAYLSRLFRRYAGEGPLQYLTRLRMQHAADLLIRHETSVQEAAEAVGFSDPFHFSRVFKRVHGLSPTGFVVQRGGACAERAR